ncbi:hypothetical protein [Methanoculleus sp. UBA377]|jgi:hypothetical protein|uniref:hypothetical protein n=1 Tax=Methanoculleus sp. UBA377 TaxID=1915506 RepID=UPI0025F6A385|nr:hypothetical protein [Methanoculleus sp. UBA377]
MKMNQYDLQSGAPCYRCHAGDDEVRHLQSLGLAGCSNIVVGQIIARVAGAS